MKLENDPMNSRNPQAVPVFGRSNLIFNLVAADGLIRIASGCQRTRGRTNGASGAFLSGMADNTDSNSLLGPRKGPYLEDVPRAVAQARLKSALTAANLWRVLGAERIALDENCLGRVTTSPIWALRSSPNFHSAAMDGFAVEALISKGAAPAAPITIPIQPTGSSRGAVC